MSTGIALLAGLSEQLIAHYGDREFTEELTAARDHYCELRGRVFEDEEHWEAFTNGFLEWYVLERELGTTGKSPARLAADREPDEGKAAGLRALASSQRCLVEIIGLGKGSVQVVDLVGGASFSVDEERSLVGMNKGDVVELRLIGFQERVWLGRLFLYHPEGTLEAIQAVIAKMRAEGASRATIIDHLALLRSRTRNYRHVSPIRIYQSNGQITEQA